MAAPRRVLVVGACGRMGLCVRAALAGEPSLRLAAALEAPAIRSSAWSSRRECTCATT